MFDDLLRQLRAIPQADLADALHRLAIVAADPLIDSAEQTESMGSSFDGVPDGDERGLWRDLRPSEAARLAELVHEAAERVQARCEPIVLAEMVAAGVAFASEHPDAPASVGAASINCATN